MKRQVFLIYALVLLAFVPSRAIGWRTAGYASLGIGALALVASVYQKTSSGPLVIEDRAGKSLTVNNIQVQSQGAYSTCGYHAIFNGMTIARVIGNGEKKKLNTILKQSLNGPHGLHDPEHPWRQLVTGRQRSLISEYNKEIYADIFKKVFPDSPVVEQQKLTQEQVERFTLWCTANDHYNPLGDERSYSQECTLRNWDPKAEFIDRSHIEFLSRELGQNDVTVLELLPNNTKQLDLRRQESTMAIEQLKKPGIHSVILMVPGHWISIVIDRTEQNRVEYFIADSLNRNRTYAPQVVHLIEIVEQPSLYQAYQRSAKQGFWGRLKSWLRR